MDSGFCSEQHKVPVQDKDSITACH